MLASLIRDLPRLCARESERIVFLDRTRWIRYCSVADTVQSFSSEGVAGAKVANLFAKISTRSKAARALKKE